MVPLSTIKTALKIGYDDDDVDLIRLREAAAALIERRTQLALTPRTETLYLARFADTTVPGLPFNAVSAVQYRDGTNTLTTMPTTDWWLDRSEGPMPVLRFLETPALYQGTNITVTYTVGYSLLPNELVHAIIALVGHWYNNPEAAQPVQMAAVPLSLGYILDHLSSRSHLR